MKRKYIVGIVILLLLAFSGIVAAAEPTTTTTPATQTVEPAKAPLKVALITIGSYKRGEERVYTDDIDFYLKHATTALVARITPHNQLPEIMKIDATSLKNPDNLKPVAGKLGVDRIIVFDAPAAPLMKTGPYKGAYVGPFTAYVMDKSGEVIANFSKTRVVMRDVDSEKIKTPPDVIRYEMSLNDETWQKNSTRAMHEFFGHYLDY